MRAPEGITCKLSIKRLMRRQKFCAKLVTRYWPRILRELRAASKSTRKTRPYRFNEASTAYSDGLTLSTEKPTRRGKTGIRPDAIKPKARW